MKDTRWLWLANKCPRKLAYWCTIRLATHATTGQYGGQVVPELTVVDTLQRWERK